MRSAVTEFERVWAGIRTTAETIASTKKTPSLTAARNIVRGIIREQRAERPPDDAIEYLALELVGLVGHYRGDGGRSTRGVTY